MNTAAVENILAETSSVQGLKMVVLQWTGMTHESFHFLLGLAVHLAVCVAWRRPLYWWGGLLGALAVAVLLEIFDLRDDWNSLGHMRLGESSKDIVHSLIAPGMILGAHYFSARWRRPTGGRSGDASRMSRGDSD